MTPPETLKKLDNEIAQVIQEVEELKERLTKDWKKNNKREKIKDEIHIINIKIQNIFDKIIELTDE